jgi:hypothetical protein
MKQKIRLNTFETNSSSTHSITLNRQYEADTIVNELDDLLDELDNRDDLLRALGLATRLVSILSEEIENYRGD